MMPSTTSLASIAGMLAMLPTALAGFSAGTNNNIAVYWGQNSYGKSSGDLAQQDLGYYCSNTDIGIIPIAFMNGISPPLTNFANSGDKCTPFASNAGLLSCPQIEADIKSCQTSNGKTILISLAGATYTQGGWSSVADAEAAAQTVWDMFGPVPSGKNVDRPFGSAVVDGFDFDFETSTNNLVAFGKKLRSLMDGAGGKKFYLAAAPQCVFPDAAVGAVLDAVAFDLVLIQFYNNWCGVTNFQEGSSTQNAFNFDVWDNWAKNTSPNKNVKLFLGFPAASGAGAGYTNGSKLKAVINYSQKYTSFAGAMIWDMSQLWANTGFLAEVVADLSGGGAAPTSPPVATTVSSVPGTTLTTRTVVATPAPTGGLVPQWGQCGGSGYTGPTQCQPPYTCVGSQWWAACQ